MRMPLRLPKYSCKNCIDRKLGCHDICEKYLSEKAEYEKMKEEALSINKEHDRYVSDSINRNMDFAARNPRLSKGRFLGCDRGFHKR